MRLKLDQTRQFSTTSIRDVTLSFGGLAVLHDVSADILNGELLALIGPNGAIEFEGQRIETRWPMTLLPGALSRCSKAGGSLST